MNGKYLATLAFGAALVVGTGASVGAADADPPHIVDPNTVIPELNPSFAPWTCFETGNGITCQGGKDDSYTNVPTDIACGGRTVYATGGERVDMTRWHDVTGLALKTQLQTGIDDRLTLSPTGAGGYVVLSGHWHKHYVYPVPGDLDSRVLTETGAITRLASPGGGLLFQDTGSVAYVPGQEYETPSQMHGVHEVYAGGTQLEVAICEGLGAA